MFSQVYLAVINLFSNSYLMFILLSNKTDAVQPAIECPKITREWSSIISLNPNTKLLVCGSNLSNKLIKILVDFALEAGHCQKGRELFYPFGN